MARPCRAHLLVRFHRSWRCRAPIRHRRPHRTTRPGSTLTSRPGSTSSPRSSGWSGRGQATHSPGSRPPRKVWPGPTPSASHFSSPCDAMPSTSRVVASGISSTWDGHRDSRSHPTRRRRRRAQPPSDRAEVPRGGRARRHRRGPGGEQRRRGHLRVGGDRRGRRDLPDRRGERYADQDHGEAARFLGRVDRSAGRRLGTLVRLKPLAHYGTGFVTDEDRTRALRAAPALVNEAVARTTGA